MQRNRRMMRCRFILFMLPGVVAGVLLMVGALIASPSEDPIFRALEDEMERSMKELQMGNLERPYYLEYYFEDGKHWTLSASLGGLVVSNFTRVRPYRVRVRVGDYHLDNSNFESGRLFGAFSGGALAGRSLPIEDDYGALRRVLWLRTDRTYKQALETLSQKRAYRRNLQAGEPIADFSVAEPVVELTPLVKENAPGEIWERELRRLSALLKDFPQIQRSSVELNVYQGNNYFLNSEGSRNRLPERVVGLRAAAALQAEDGSPLRNETLILVRSLDELPESSALEERVRGTAAELIQLADAALAGDYSGPVLFTAEAAARLMAVLLAPHLSGTRPPERPEGGGFSLRGLSRGSAWGSRWKARVLPAFIEVTDDPTRETFNGSHLMGSFTVDREGVRAAPVRLVRNGRLVNFLMSRSPRRGISRSNGHGRALSSAGVVQAKPGNLFVTATQSAGFGELKAQLIEEAKAQEKPFGILVRKVGPVVPAGARSFALAMETAGGALGGAFSGLPEGPVLAYRVWVEDGREELIRGLQFSSMSPRSLRDILAAGDEPAVYNHLAVASSLSGVELLPTSIIAPALLFDDLELKATRGQTRKLPVLPPPFANRP